MDPKITRIESMEFEYPLEDIGRDPNGFNYIYRPGSTAERTLYAIRIHTDTGVAGEYVGGNSPSAAEYNMFADYLIGENPLDRERHWSEIKRALRKYDRMGMGPIDIALWDFAGKYHESPIYKLLGAYQTKFPVYASTLSADQNGGLDSPSAYADFAEHCFDLGYPAYKIHPWSGSDKRRDIAREIDLVRTVGNRVGEKMDLMLDPACEYETFADALKVGRACDDHDFLWYEDPYRDGGISQHGHRKLRDLLDTPLLQTEHVRGLEPHADFIQAEATDFVRADPEYDAGITGAMKIARVAEGFGLDVEFHAPGPAQRHCIAAIRNTNYYEMALVHPDCSVVHPDNLYLDEYSDGLEAIDGDGMVSVPDKPGLGVEYNWDYIHEHQTGSVHTYE